MITFEKVTEALLAYAIPTASAAMLSWLTYTIKTSRKRQDALEEGVKCLLRDRIIQAYRHHVVDGHEVSAEEYTSSEDMIKSYKVLKGGNGYIERIAEEYERSPIDGQH